MQRPCLRSLALPVYRSCGCAKVILLLLFFIVYCVFPSLATVTVTTPTTGINICSNKAATGSAPGFTTLATIMISEGNNADIAGAAGGITNTLVLVPPTGWQFGTTAPTFTFTAGSNITAVTGSITSTSLTVNITANNTNGGDQVFISGLQVQATSTTSAPGNIYPTSSVGITGIVTGASGTNFSSLSLTSPVTPSVSIATAPAGAVCPGTNVTFNPTPVNGGTSPVYQWYVNGSNVATGSTYTNSTLANGNIVSCTMVPALTCVTSTTATSNTLTMTVNAAPAAITGSAITCPSSITSLSSATGGGTWSSSNTGVATVNSSGVVSGVAAGSVRISYTAGGCAAVRTVYVNAAPTAPSLSPTTAIVCSGNSVTISAAGSPLPSSILTQNFNSGIIPWTVDTTGSVSTLPGAEWKSCGDGYINEQGLYHSPDNSAFAMSNSDTSGSASYTSSKLISPVFSLIGYSSASLSFQHAYQHWLAGDFNVDVEISTNGGASWSTLRSYTGTDVGMRTAFAADTLSLNAYLGYSSVKVRFNYYCHWGYYWAVDNVMINGSSAIATPTWSPTATLYTDPALTTPYVAGTPVNNVYAVPTTGTTTTVVTYTATATIPGCSSMSTTLVTVNPLPGTITGVLNTCTGTSTSLSNIVTGGVWSSVNTSVATINSGGVATGVSPGTSIISYASGLCAATAVLTVNVTPADIAGPVGVCITSTATLSNASIGGTWSSSNTSVATIGSATGIVHGLTLGTATITYSLGAGCIAIRTITVNPLPLAITGTAEVCPAQTTALFDATPGGTWSTDGGGILSVGSSSGVVTGIASGTAFITYTLPTACTATRIVTVNPLPAPITGGSSICVDDTTTLSDISTGGTWSSSNTTTATVGSMTGLVTGNAAGSVNIVYTFPTGCFVVKAMTVNGLPPAIEGVAQVCHGLTTSLTNTTPGGMWSSSDPAVGTIGSSSGILGGISPGTAQITYTAPTGCTTKRAVTVNSLPGIISGPSTVCPGTSITLVDTPAGGTWASLSSTASVDATTGVVTGTSAGAAVIMYILPTGCQTTKTLTVNSLPMPIAGSSNVCVGSNLALTDGTAGGTWSSSNIAAGTINAGGVVSGIAPGVTNISYTIPTGCYVTLAVSVNPWPVPISGASNVCLAASTSLTDATAGGSWVSGNTSIAVFGSASGVVTGYTIGTVNITYMMPGGCYAVNPMVVNSLPVSISGPSTVCQGSTVVLSDLTPGGSWTSSNTSIATVVSGTVTGLAIGSATITYMMPTGCYVTKNITVNIAPAAITGTTGVCPGSMTTLSNTVSGGVWSVGMPSVAVVSPGGVITGLTPGTTIVSYSIGICRATTTVTVYVAPPSISGLNTICQGQTITLSNSMSGGSWASNSTLATIGSGSGIVTGTGSVVATISYIMPTGCYAGMPFTVNATPTIISGSTSMCVGNAVLYSSSPSGGAWSSSNPSVAGINPSGLAIGYSAGSTVISYGLPSGCYTTTAVTVSSLPAPITGGLTLCIGSTSSLSCSTTGGMWSSSNLAAGTIGVSSGVLAGVAAGTTGIMYVLPSGCASTAVATVNALPVITGPNKVCLGSAISLSSTPGGTWSSVSANVLVGSSTGVVNGIATGTAIITYTAGPGCVTTTTITVEPLPAFITGTLFVCHMGTTTLANVTTGGTWSSSGPVVGVSATGVVTGFTVGTSPVTYTAATGCYRVVTVTVNALPPAIDGASTVCSGRTTTLSNTATGGAWSSGTPSVASIISTTGVVSGVAAGTSRITYTTAAGCITTKILTVDPSPVAIAGSPQVCVGGAVSLSNTTSGGVWSSSYGAVATISTSGVVSGIMAGTSVMRYTLSSGCAAELIFTVNPLPAPITGPLTVCIGSMVSLSSASSGGSWMSSDLAVASVGSAGNVSGLTVSPATITYVLPTGCFTARGITVNPLPTSIGGTSAVCQGSTTTLNNATPGGTWTSVIPGIASVGSSTGIVTGISDGIAVISYTIPNGCAATLLYTVHPLAAINGPANACLGQTTMLSNAVIGGTWFSSNTAVATVGSTLGDVSGITLGTATITYTMPTGCFITKNITVNPSPAAITGVTSACMGSSMSLSNATSGGIWSSSATGIAPVSSLGLVTALAAGTAVIVYSLPTGCASYAAVTVNPLYPIVGTAIVCSNDTLALTNAAPGGIWTSVNPGIVTVSTTGLITGISAGTSLISYLLPTGCLATRVVTVNAGPASYTVTGGGGYCTGGSGVAIGLSNSASSVNYRLYMGATLISSVAGTGSLLSFGVFSTAGTYTVAATNTITGCSRNMAGTAVVSILPYSTPSVTVTTTSAGLICAGLPATFTPVPSYGGSAPTYVWRVNGILSGMGTTYTYTPVSGDIVSCKLTSNATCVSPDTASGSMTVSPVAPAVPSVSIAATPGDTMCPMTTITITPTPVNGGSLPWYTWMVNGASAGVSATYTYAPVNGDNVYCIMHSNQFCISNDTAWSNYKVFTVYPSITPTVTIAASPGLFVAAGTTVALTAMVSGGGSAPAYQWLLNGANIPGATTGTYISSSFVNNDSVSCIVTNTDTCAAGPGPSHAVIHVKNVSVTDDETALDLSLLPNPNTGSFTLQGITAYTGEVTLEVTNLLGQTVYHSSFVSHSKKIHEQVALDRHIANGMYLLNVNTACQRRTLHFVIER